MATSAKSAEAFRTISEVALDLQVPQHVLRFWETKFSQIKPLKRGGGRRYYRPEDVDLLRGIRHLLYDDGYTIKGVQKVLRENGARHVMDNGRGGETAASTGEGLRKTPANDQNPQPAAGNSQEAELRRALKDVLAELKEIRKLIAKGV